MRRLIWAKAFRRAFKKIVKERPDVFPKVKKALRLLAEDPFHTELHSHKLKGRLEGMWACNIDYHNRILFMFLKNPDSGLEDILLISMGTHREVY